MEIRKLIILAASAKYNNFCVAGVDIDTGAWIRPISEKLELEEAVPLEDLKYPDGSRVELLDVVEIKFSDRSANNPIQPENFFYNAKYFWQKSWARDVAGSYRRARIRFARQNFFQRRAFNLRRGR